ncbi:hypothetical protein [Flavobacterium yafengii]|uniref:hypothetical protein n=1 Tax=Flavobacterium yafengii TaxID=3041253 RepID=UPI0024A91A25|nr:hypothetical protein [Flavobacterium yafengii]MDI5897908.1 hypothetical protein [Flavobacterium yafengii]
MNKSMDSKQSDVYLFLKETAKEYIEKHDKRLKEFLDEFEADEIDYIEKEMSYFENTLYDVQNSESSHDGYSVTGYDNFSLAYELVINIGSDKFMYSTKAKLKFLENQIVVDLPNQNQHSNNNEHQKNTNTLNWIGEQPPAPETKKTLTNFDKILKELKIIETIFHSQMNPDLHLGSGIGLPRYCNKIFIVSDIELLKISDYKREYTSRLEQSNNTLLANCTQRVHLFSFPLPWFLPTASTYLN